jgi:hypothetical protein
VFQQSQHGWLVKKYVGSITCMMNGNMNSTKKDEKKNNILDYILYDWITLDYYMGMYIITWIFNAKKTERHTKKNQWGWWNRNNRRYENFVRMKMKTWAFRKCLWYWLKPKCVYTFWIWRDASFLMYEMKNSISLPQIVKKK